MREIKFRLRIGDEIVGYEKWRDDTVVEPSYGCWWVYSRDNEMWSAGSISHTDKDQFTGLCDKKGKEIYEGDILQDTYIINNQEHKSRTMQVLWIPEDCCFGLKPSTPYDYSPLNSNKHREIIGDVFQNKDLLKEKP